MPTHYLPSPAQPFMIPPSSLHAQLLQPPTLHPPSFQPAHPQPQAPPTLTQIPVQQPLSSYPHIPTLPTLPILPPQMPPTGFVRPVFTQHIAVAPPTSQSTLTPATSLPLPPPPPSDSGLPQNWKTAKDPQGTTYYYHVITRKTQWTRPTETDADGSVTMELASSDEEDSSQAESLRAPCTPDGTPPPLATTTERNYDTESTDVTPSPYYSPLPRPHTPSSPHLPHSLSHSSHRSPLPSPRTPPFTLPPPSTPPFPSTNYHHHQQQQQQQHSPSPLPSPKPLSSPLPGPSTPPLSPPLSPPHSPTTTTTSLTSPLTHSPPPLPRPPRPHAHHQRRR
ncbi:Histone-lysine N-methyltransferase SETD2 [Geodia barretti]|uniref:Histone-lysine N-methyltransferase SETD2 n=2 Tax=Geodia barretti TaxID=519541 RepID=A0AA35WQI2_GEOBA|nr:Histone-lysine N-methyltransferase SETD2 [Geodia barretti]